MITIRSLNKKSLFEFIYSKEYQHLENIPISRHRAISHIKNPRAQEQDVLLYLAYEQTQMVGYLGVLPDTFFYNNTSKHCGWLSCLWVDTRFRGRKIAYKLLQKSIDDYEGKILITEFTNAAKGLYDKSGFFDDLTTKVGIRLYVRADLSKILPPKHKIFQTIKPGLKLLDHIFNNVADLRFARYKKVLDELTLEYVEHIDTEIETFIKTKQQNQLFKRGIDELNWMLNNPWILDESHKDKFAEKYHFSSIDKSFDFIPIKLYNDNDKLIAFLIFAKRNNNLKLPYCYYSDDLQPVMRVIRHHIVLWKIKTFTTYHTALTQALKQQSSPALFKKEVRRSYMLGKAFEFYPQKHSFVIQDGDGDCAFT